MTLFQIMNYPTIWTIELLMSLLMLALIGWAAIKP